MNKVERINVKNSCSKFISKDGIYMLVLNNISDNQLKALPLTKNNEDIERNLLTFAVENGRIAHIRSHGEPVLIEKIDQINFDFVKTSFLNREKNTFDEKKSNNHIENLFKMLPNQTKVFIEESDRINCLRIIWNIREEDNQTYQFENEDECFDSCKSSNDNKNFFFVRISCNKAESSITSRNKHFNNLKNNNDETELLLKKINLNYDEDINFSNESYIFNKLNKNSSSFDTSNKKNYSIKGLKNNFSKMDLSNNKNNINDCSTRSTNTNERNLEKSSNKSNAVYSTVNDSDNNLDLKLNELKEYIMFYRNKVNTMRKNRFCIVIEKKRLLNKIILPNFDVKYDKIKVTTKRNNKDLNMSKQESNRLCRTKVSNYKEELFGIRAVKRGRPGKAKISEDENKTGLKLQKKLSYQTTNTQDTQTNKNKCTICMEKFTSKCLIEPCKHAFCLECITNWKNNSTYCPLCMQPFKKITKENKIISIIKKTKNFKYHDNDQEEEEVWFENLMPNCMICKGEEDSMNILVCDTCNKNICHYYCDGLSALPNLNEPWSCSYCRGDKKILKQRKVERRLARNKKTIKKAKFNKIKGVSTRHTSRYKFRH